MDTALNIKHVSLHRVGNSHNEEYLELSESEIELTEVNTDSISAYFGNAFGLGQNYQFYSEDQLENNKLYKIAQQIFHGEVDFHAASREIASLLFEAAQHPQIKSGDLYVAYFTELSFEGQAADAIGIFKSENRDTVLQVSRKVANFQIAVAEGTNIQKLDKSCIIYNLQEDSGFLVNVSDQTNRGQDARYWIDQFLGLRRCVDDFAHTEVNLKICKEFIVKELPQHFEIPKVEQADLLKRSIAYFKESDQFDIQEFGDHILGSEVAETYKNFRREYAEKHETELSDQFDVSPQAVKKQARVFKSILKLDRNFHIYIHGDKSLIERVEEDGKKYYKIYFREEQ